MDRDKLKSLLADIGLDAGRNRGSFKDSGNNVQFNCPFHGETRPSCGINVDTEVGYCFACGEGFNLAKLVAHCMDFTLPRGEYNYAKAYDWLEERYGVEKKVLEKDELNLIRIDEDFYNKANNRYELPLVKIAPFRSGKETHQYYYDRGFDVNDVKTFKIGWDRIRLRVTMPAFWEDGTLCGIIGRAVLPEKIDGKLNPQFYKLYKGGNALRYYIYENFPVGDILYPLWLFKPRKNGRRKSAILVEGFLDAQWMHKMGYPETLSSVNSKLSFDKQKDQCKQRDILIKHGVTDIILMRDSDSAGRKGNAHDYNILKEYFNIYSVTYPEGKKDPQSLTKSEIDSMIRHKKLYRLRHVPKLKRL